MGEPIDYWREVVRRGVMALGLSIVRHASDRLMIAELAAPQEGLSSAPPTPPSISTS